MKKINYLVILLACMAVSCKEKTGDTEPPAKIEHYKVVEINGGAVITYEIPSSDDLLCVTVEYVRNGEPYRESASAYKNSIRVEGFKTTEPVTALLYSEDRHGNRSEAVEVFFKPLKAPVTVAQESFQWNPDFGGVTIAWENPEKIELGIRLMAADSIGAWEVVTDGMWFSSSALGKHTFENLKAKETAFAVTIEDKWGNSSDTLYFTTTPFYQIMLPKPYGDMRWQIPWDNTSYHQIYDFTEMWDNDASGGWPNGGYVSGNGSYGCSFTIELQQAAKLNKVVLHGWWAPDRPGTFYDVYDQVNIMSFDMYGIKTFDQSLLGDKAYWLDDVTMGSELYAAPGATIPPLPAHTFKDDWYHFGYFEAERLDKKGAPLEEILALAMNGHVFKMPLDAPPVRYIRIFPRTTEWGGVTGPPPLYNYWRVGELSFYGDNTVQ
jgi:hypothetical protein